MLNAKKLLKMVYKWQKFAALGRKRITSAAADRSQSADACSCSIASRGHIFVYTADNRRFTVPLKYLSSAVFVELLKMSEEEFGLPADGPVMLPCDAACMEKIMSTLQKRSTIGIERAVLAFIGNFRCTASLIQNRVISQQSFLYGF